MEIRHVNISAFCFEHSRIVAASNRFYHVSPEDFLKRTEKLASSSTMKKVQWMLDVFRAFQEE